MRRPIFPFLFTFALLAASILNSLGKYLQKIYGNSKKRILRKYQMSYMQELRQLVGNRPLIMVGATLLALNQDNQLLMIKRTDNRCWGVPGGAMELGEELENTVKRETKEEIGIDVKDLELFGVYSGQDLYYRYPNGAEVYNVSVVYLTRNISAAIQVNPHEHSEYRYFDIHNLPAQISPPIKSILRDLVAKET